MSVRRKCKLCGLPCTSIRTTANKMQLASCIDFWRYFTLLYLHRDTSAALIGAQKCNFPPLKETMIYRRRTNHPKDRPTNRNADRWGHREFTHPIIRPGNMFCFVRRIFPPPIFILLTFSFYSFLWLKKKHSFRLKLHIFCRQPDEQSVQRIAGRFLSAWKAINIQAVFFPNRKYYNKQENRILIINNC